MKAWTALIFMALAGCAALPEVTDRDASVLLMGDSVLAWNRGQGASVADVVEAETGRAVQDVSVPGARMRQGGLRASLGFSIPDQYRAGDWDAVIVNGGANDLLGACGCRQCDAVLDRLVTQDYPALLDRLGDTEVIIVAYYGQVRGGGGSFDGCGDELAELERRLRSLAASRSNVTQVSVRDVIAGDPANYDADRVHPSPAGSRAIGGLVARALVANSGASR